MHSVLGNFHFQTGLVQLTVVVASSYDRCSNVLKDLRGYSHMDCKLEVKEMEWWQAIIIVAVGVYLLLNLR